MQLPHLAPLLALLTILTGPARSQGSAGATAPGTAGIEALQETTTAAAGQQLSEPVPLVVWNREIAVLRVDLGGVTTQERARRAAERILALPDDPLGPTTHSDRRSRSRPRGSDPYPAST
ncbi:hypothetical protein [Engelhardtia mirabilis]|uniref:Uncharacterized protein n=1 Tax=Engelhardtia mirabilis TaxID=2528011 RepID=A0A518BMH4_9BACT|nr:hypothetical protein Pla133_32780 [Planctomycetes bacterium Pla133]QDV02510.1 hypothetical protein Pla86_32770 [Planctomycetes bacterium Pla86]